MTKHDNVSQGKIMKATEFVKKVGIEKARELIKRAPSTATHFNYNSLGGHYAREGVLKMKTQWEWFNTINKEWYYDFAEYNHFELSELKRLVESHESVQSHGGLECAKKTVNYPFYLDKPDCGTCYRLSKAIADVEACHEVN